jgi:hypothetical protein
MITAEEIFQVGRLGKISYGLDDLTLEVRMKLLRSSWIGKFLVPEEGSTK